MARRRIQPNATGGKTTSNRTTRKKPAGRAGKKRAQTPTRASNIKDLAKPSPGRSVRKKPGRTPARPPQKHQPPIKATESPPVVGVFLVDTMERVAQVWGVSVHTVKDWRKAGMPGDEGQWDVTEICRWYHRHFGTGAVGGIGEDLRESMAKAKLAREAARAQRETIEVQRLQGSLIDVTESDARRMAIVRWVVGVFDRAGSELASAIAGKQPAEAKRRVIAYFDKLRREVAAGE